MAKYIGRPIQQLDDDEDPRPKEQQLKFVVCPQCKKEFRLIWNDYSFGNRDQKQTLHIRSCPSGGVYDVSIECPHCDYEEDL